MAFIPNLQTKIDPNNSSSSILNADFTFSGTSTNNLGYNSLLINLISDKDSAPNGLIVYYSKDNANWTINFTDTYIYKTKYTKTLLLTNNYYKIEYINGSSDQTSFNLVTSISLTNPNNNDMINTIFTDTYNRFQVVEPMTLIDMRFYSTGLNSNAQMITTNSSGNYNSSITNSVSTITGSGIGHYKSQSAQYAVYQPGKSMLIYASGILNGNTNSATIISKIGYFDDSNGIYFSYTNNSAYINVIVGGNVTSIQNANWNGDKLDGTGNSGYIADYSKMLLFGMQFSWLGVGIIRFSIILAGQPIICHTVYNYNTLTNPWIYNPNLPIRYELSSTNNDSNGEMIQGCASCISVGGYNPTGRLFCANNGYTGVQVSTRNEYTLLAITGNSNYYHQIVKPTLLNIMDATSGTSLILIRMYPHGISPGVLVWNDVNTDYSLVKYSTTNIENPQTTGSIIIGQTYSYGKSGDVSLTNISNIFTEITSNITNNPTTIVITVQTNNNGKIYVGLTWEEIY